MASKLLLRDWPLWHTGEEVKDGGRRVKAQKIKYL